MTIALIPNSIRRVSPSSMNTYYKCPRLYYFKYIKFLKEPASIHMVKGSVVHNVLELFYNKYEANLKKRLLELLKLCWKLPPELILSKKEEKDAYKDCENILLIHLSVIEVKYKTLIGGHKAENVRHAFYLTRPKFKELKLENKEFNLVGIIDTVSTDFDGNITLGDYKTGGSYGFNFSDDLKRQLSFYALMYYLENSKYPQMVAVDHLRYGIRDRLVVTPSLISSIMADINFVITHTQSDDKDDYPLKENNLCAKYCSFFDICSGNKSLACDKQSDLIKMFDLKEKGDKDESEINTRKRL